MAGEEKVYQVVPPTPGSEAYWEGANAGKLLLGHCKPCNKAFYYPRGACPMCLSTDVEMRAAKARDPKGLERQMAKAVFVKEPSTGR